MSCVVWDGHCAALGGSGGLSVSCRCGIKQGQLSGLWFRDLKFCGLISLLSFQHGFERIPEEREGDGGLHS